MHCGLRRGDSERIKGWEKLPSKHPQLGHLMLVYGAELHSLFSSRRVRNFYYEHGIREQNICTSGQEFGLPWYVPDGYLMAKIVWTVAAATSGLPNTCDNQLQPAV